MSLNIEPPPKPQPEAARIIRERVVAAPIAAQASEEVVQTQEGVVQSERVVTDSVGGVQHSERVVRDVGAEHLLRVAKTCQVIWLVAVIVEVLIGFRVVLKLIGANPANAFAGFSYNIAAPFLAPFFGLTGSPAAGGSVLEVPSIIGMLIYAFVAWGVVRIIKVLFDRPVTGSSSTYDRTRI